jgi:hypothetical protein
MLHDLKKDHIFCHSCDLLPESSQFGSLCLKSLVFSFCFAISSVAVVTFIVETLLYFDDKPPLWR